MPKKDDDSPMMVDELDHAGNPTGNKVRSGGEVSAEPQPPGGGPPGRNPVPQQLDTPDAQDDDSKKSQPAKKK